VDQNVHQAVDLQQGCSINASIYYKSAVLMGDSVDHCQVSIDQQCLAAV
jgi:hypothetical protein